MQDADRAQAEDEDVLAPLDPDLVLAVDDGVERLDEGATLDGRGRVELDDATGPDPVSGHREALGHPAGQVVAEDAPAGTEVRMASPARSAREARRARAHRDRRARRERRNVRLDDDARDLVPGDLRATEPWAAVPPRPDVRSADADGERPQDQSTGRQGRLGDVVEPQIARAVEDDRLHRSAASASARTVGRVSRTSWQNQR